MAPEKETHNEDSHTRFGLIDWWVGTVLFTFFPLIVSAIMGLCTAGSIDFNRLIGDGELILSAFSVSTPSLLRLHNSKTNDVTGKIHFYILLVISFLQLVAYTSTKLNQNRNPLVVYITSVCCVASSILFARSCEKYLG